MKSKKTAAIGMAMLLVLTMVTLLFGLAWPSLQIQAGPTLPPLAIATPGPDKDTGSSSSSIAHIELHTTTGSWSVVQWQDSDGNWHDVDGWRGAVSGGQVRWAVEAKDFNTGPFRWAVMDGAGEQVVGTSDSFNLPASGNEIVSVTVN